MCVSGGGGKPSAHWRTTPCCPFEAFEPRRQWRPLNRAILRPDHVLRILHFRRSRKRGHAASIAASLAESALLPRDTCPSSFPNLSGSIAVAGSSRFLAPPSTGLNLAQHLTLRQQPSCRQ